MTMQHVQIPTIKDLKENNLKPKDLLVYAAIAKFKNGETDEAFPAIKTIGNEIGMTAPTIIKSIAALEKAGLITITTREGTSSIYKFTDYSSFEMFSYDFLEKVDLSQMEKAYIISVQSKLFKDKATRTGSTTYTNQELSQLINMDRGTISKIDKSLQDKGILNLIKINAIDSETGLAINQKVFNFDEFANGVVFEFIRQDERITSVERAQEAQQRTNKELSEKLKKMEIILAAKDINVDEEYTKIQQRITL